MERRKAIIAVTLLCTLAGCGRSPSAESVEAAVRAHLAEQWAGLVPADPQVRRGMGTAELAVRGEIQSSIRLVSFNAGAPARQADGSFAVPVTYRVEYISGGRLFRYDTATRAFLVSSGMFSWKAIGLDRLRTVGGAVSN